MRPEVEALASVNSASQVVGERGVGAKSDIAPDFGELRDDALALDLEVLPLIDLLLVIVLDGCHIGNGAWEK